jgi:ATP synthase protein I
VAKLTARNEAYRIVYWQLMLIIGLALVLLFIQGIRSGLSVALGGLAYWLPTLLFVWRVFARTTARAARQFMVAFVLGETIKLFLSAILFVLIVKYLPVQLLSVLIGFVGAVIAFWISAVILLTKDEEVAP